MSELEAFLDRLAFAALFGPFLPLTIGLFRLPRLSAAQKWFLTLMGISILAQGLGEYISWQTRNNLPVFHLYILLEFVCMLMIYRKLIVDFLGRKTFVLFLIAFPVLVFANGTWLDTWFQYPSVTRSAESIVFLMLTGLYFYSLFKEMKIQYPDREFLFWVSAGNLIFFSSNLLVFIFLRFLIESAATLATKIWLMHTGLTLILYLPFSIAMACKDSHAEPEIRDAPRH